MPDTERILLFLRQHGRALLLLLMAVLAVHDIFGQHGFLAMRRTEREIARIKQELGQLNEENRQLAEQVKALKSDPQLIEKIARDELGLARPGEVIIKIPQPVTSRPAGAQPNAPAKP